MNIIHQGDLWELRGSDWLVVFTNIGWRSDGSNVMGRGIAREANERYPGLDKMYGLVLRAWCDAQSPSLGGLWVYEAEKLILMPTKQLNREAPYLSWSQPSDLGLIERGLRSLQERPWDRQVWLGMPGCGNGKLDPEDVIKLMYPILDDRFTVRWPG